MNNECIIINNAYLGRILTSCSSVIEVTITIMMMLSPWSSLYVPRTVVFELSHWTPQQSYAYFTDAGSEAESISPLVSLGVVA